MPNILKEKGVLKNADQTASNSLKANPSKKKPTKFSTETLKPWSVWNGIFQLGKITTKPFYSI